MIPLSWRYLKASRTHATQKRPVMSSKLPLSLRMVHSSPPRHASINMYTYFLSLKVLYNLKKKNQHTKYTITGEKILLSFRDNIRKYSQDKR